jgi:surfactin synthase thioesterase subunit
MCQLDALPTAFFGHSMGASVAFEVAVNLTTASKGGQLRLCSSPADQDPAAPAHGDSRTPTTRN